MKYLLIGYAMSFSTAINAQEITQSQLPPLIVRNFQAAFPGASDIEWKRDGENYKVEFELGVFMLTNDHDVWFDKTGSIVKHKEEISKNGLPQNVLTKIKNDFTGYRIEDPKKITEGHTVIYEMELKKQRSEWKVVIDENGNILSRKED